MRYLSINNCSFFYVADKKRDSTNGSWSTGYVGVSENGDSYEKPMDFGVVPWFSEAKRRASRYQPIHLASLFHHTLCVETSFGVSKRMASYVIWFFGPCTCWDERGHLTDTYCLVSACVGFTPISAVSLPTLLLWCKSSGNQSNGCCGYSSFLDEFPMKCSHFGGYFPGTSSFPQHTWPAAWSGPAGRGSCWGPWHKLHILRIYCLAMWRHYQYPMDDFSNPQILGLLSWNPTWLLNGFSPHFSMEKCGRSPEEG